MNWLGLPTCTIFSSLLSVLKIQKWDLHKRQRDGRYDLGKELGGTTRTQHDTPHTNPKKGKAGWVQGDVRNVSCVLSSLSFFLTNPCADPGPVPTGAQNSTGL